MLNRTPLRDANTFRLRRNTTVTLTCCYSVHPLGQWEEDVAYPQNPHHYRTALHIPNHNPPAASEVNKSSLICKANHVWKLMPVKTVVIKAVQSSFPTVRLDPLEGSSTT